MLKLQQGGLIIHLGMSGSLRILQHPMTPEKHDHVDVELQNGVCLRFNDPRRFGAFLWVDGEMQSHELLRNLGPEPLSDEFTADYLYQRSRNRSVAIKNFIMNGHVVVGVGNIYASEALFMAGIHPQRAAGRVSRQRYEGLVAAIRDVLDRAIRRGGTTLRDFVNSDGAPGYFAQELLVYDRAGSDCFQCGSSHQTESDRSKVKLLLPCLSTLARTLQQYPGPGSEQTVLFDFARITHSANVSISGEERQRRLVQCSG